MVVGYCREVFSENWTRMNTDFHGFLSVFIRVLFIYGVKPTLTLSLSQKFRSEGENLENYFGRNGRYDPNAT